jgi:DNA invertase Pin-like site-specific DNA recombinase
MRKRVGIYARVSTRDQSVQQQLDALRAWAQGRGFEVVEEFVDEGVSGADEKRPALSRLRKACTGGRVDVVAAVALDRLGRSLTDLVGLLREFSALGVDIYLQRESVDTSTPAGRALLQMAGVFAEFERSILIERVKAGIQRARTYGTRSGKAIGRPPISERKKTKVRSLVAQGMSEREAARAVGVSRATVYRILAEDKHE